MSTITDTESPATRTTEQGNEIEVAMIRGFLKRTLSDDAVVDGVNDLLFTHVVKGAITLRSWPNRFGPASRRSSTRRPLRTGGRSPTT